MAFFYIKNASGGAGAGDATAANQTTQINEAVTTNTKLDTIITNQSAGTNAGVLVDTSRTLTLTGSLASLTTEACKSVTLINLSTNTASMTYTVNGGASLTLEAGYSVKVNVANADDIQVSSTAGEELQYIVTA